MADVIPFLTEQNRPRVTLKSDGPFELKTMLERSCLAEDPTRPCLRIIRAPLTDEATGETVAHVSLTFEVIAMDLTAAPPNGIFSGSVVTTGKRSSRRRYHDRMYIRFEAVEEANTFKVDGYGVNDRIGKYRMEGTAVAQGDGLYLDMKRIKDKRARSSQTTEHEGVSQLREECKLLGGWASCGASACGEPSPRRPHQSRLVAAAPEDEELAGLLGAREPNRSIFRAVPYPAHSSSARSSWDGEPNEFLAACASTAMLGHHGFPTDCIKPDSTCACAKCQMPRAVVNTRTVPVCRGCHGAMQVQVAGNVISSVDIN